MPDTSTTFADFYDAVDASFTYHQRPIGYAAIGRHGQRRPA